MKLPFNLCHCSLVLLVISAALVDSAYGQYRPGPYYGAPRRTAIVQYISGEVSVAPVATNEWTAARLNQPLPPSEHIWTGKDSRVEISVGYGFIRMDSEASVTIRALTPTSVQIGVNQGQVSVTVLRLFPGEVYELDAPNATLTVMKTGVYSVEARPAADQTVVTTRKGSIVATGTGNAVTIGSGHQVVFRAGNSLQHTEEKAPPPSGFEQWASVRDQRLKINRPPFVVFGYGPYPVGVPGPLPPP